jgi:type II secretory pathway component PulM
MSAVWDRLAALLMERSRRERWLLLVLVLGTLPLGLWQGVAVPMIERQAQARAALAVTRATEVWVAEQAVEHARLRRAAGDGAGRAAAPVGMSGLEKALREAGLRADVAELANTADGGITLRFDAVRFSWLAAWLSAQSGQWGYDLDAFTIERGEREDVVAADLRLVPVPR